MIRSVPLTALEVDGHPLGFATAVLTISTHSGSWVVDIELLSSSTAIQQGVVYPLRLVADPDTVFTGHAQFTDYIADLVPLMTFTGIRALKEGSMDRPVREDTVAS